MPESSPVATLERPDLVATGRERRSWLERGIIGAWAPVGFVADHVETLYDLDIEARGMTQRLGLTLTRVPALTCIRA
ncbi:MAG TPA: ferrochelatase [Polyangiaceae bacterium]|nr:ferrochelatase [Polyangiaceae bacterium]